MKTKNLNFEDALLTLDELTQTMENEDNGLEASLKMYEEGKALVAHCSSLLESAKKRVQKLKVIGKDETPQQTETLFDLEDFV